MPAFEAQLFSVGMVLGAMDQATAAEEVQAAVASMRPDRVVLLDDQGAERAMRFLLGGNRAKPDDRVGFGRQVQQHVAER